MRALVLAALLLAPTGARAEAVQGDAPVCAAGSSAIEVQITGLKDRAGEMRVELYPDHDPDFLGDKNKLIAAGKTFRRVVFPVPAGGPLIACLAAPGPGRYSLAIIHDRLANRKFDFRKDGVAFPGDPALFLGKPAASKAWVTVGQGVTRLTVRLQYYNGFLSIGPVRHPVDAVTGAAASR